MAVQVTDSLPADESDDDITLAEACTADLLEGYGASEDHETFLAALRAGGLSEATAKEVHRRTMTHPDAPNMKHTLTVSAESALRKVLAVVQRYLPPDGTPIKDAMSEIISIVDPWPLEAPAAASGEAVDLETEVHCAIGHASMCWSEVPTGEFDSDEALKVGEALLSVIRSALAKANPAAGAEPDDKRLTLLMAPEHLNLIVGKDRADLLSYARRVWLDGRRATPPATSERDAEPNEQKAWEEWSVGTDLRDSDRAHFSAGFTAALTTSERDASAMRATLHETPYSRELAKERAKEKDDK